MNPSTISKVKGIPKKIKTHPNKNKTYARMLEENAKQNQIAKDANFKRDWIIKCGVIVERPQVLTPVPEEWFAKYEEWKQRWNNPILAQLPPVVVLDEDLDEKKQRIEDQTSKQKAREKALKEENEEEKKERLVREEREKRLQEIRDSHVKVEVKKVRSRFTEADKKDDKKSVYRCLDKKLFLIVKKNREDSAWQFPQGDRDKTDKTMRLAAEREFQEECNVNNSIEVHFAGNGPLAHYTYAFNSEVQKEIKAYGAKVFFYYSFYLNGEISIDGTEIVDYLWVTKSELKDYIHPSLLKLTNDMLPDDGIKDTITKRHYIGTPERD